MHALIRFSTISAVTLLVTCGLAHAQSSAWSEDLRSAVRLIAGDTAKQPMHAGVEMKLQAGWHTYWRYPGDSGVPPQFDFSRSENLKSATVLYPAPQLHKDAGGETIGYAQDVIFPVQVVPINANKAVRLHLSLDYAVCENMCIPAKGEAELVLTPGNGARNPALDRAEAQVPVKETAAAADLHVKRQGDKAVIDFGAPAGTPVTVYAEGPTADWALPIPKPVEAPSGRRAFAFKLDGLPPGTDPKKPADLTFTILEGDRAFEVTTRLD